jgi:hypothetical protein
MKKVLFFAFLISAVSILVLLFEAGQYVFVEWNCIRYVRYAVEDSSAPLKKRAAKLQKAQLFLEEHHMTGSDTDAGNKQSNSHEEFFFYQRVKYFANNLHDTSLIKSNIEVDGLKDFNRYIYCEMEEEGEIIYPPLWIFGSPALNRVVVVVSFKVLVMMAGVFIFATLEIHFPKFISGNYPYFNKQRH